MLPGTLIQRSCHRVVTVCSWLWQLTSAISFTRPHPSPRGSLPSQASPAETHRQGEGAMRISSTLLLHSQPCCSMSPGALHVPPARTVLRTATLSPGCLPHPVQAQHPCALAGAPGPCKVGQGLAFVPHVTAAPLASSHTQRHSKRSSFSSSNHFTSPAFPVAGQGLPAPAPRSFSEAELVSVGVHITLVLTSSHPPHSLTAHISTFPDPPPLPSTSPNSHPNVPCGQLRP